VRCWLRNLMKYKTLPSVHVIVTLFGKYLGANCGQGIGERTIITHKILRNSDNVVGSKIGVTGCSYNRIILYCIFDLIKFAVLKQLHCN
jgi:hypothetical protein